MSGRLLIVGAGGHGRVVADIASQLNFSEIVFVDRRWPNMVQNMSWPVIASEIPTDLEGWSVAIAVGHNQRRLDILRELKQRQAQLPNLIHPDATVSPNSQLGAGLIVAAQAVVGVGSTIGDAAIINTSSSVDHDCELGDGVHISPGAHLAGTVRVGNCSWVGIGAVIREGISVGQNVVVGAGAVVISDVKDGLMVSGIPARPMR